jgi:hypothetical protein
MIIDTPYGFCPICGALGKYRERRPNGRDRCINAHIYPSKNATLSPIVLSENKLLLNNIHNTLQSDFKVINAKTISNDHGLNECLRHHAITMLEIGKCQVLNKKTCEIITFAT